MHSESRCSYITDGIKLSEICRLNEFLERLGRAADQPPPPAVAEVKLGRLAVGGRALLAPTEMESPVVPSQTQAQDQVWLEIIRASDP